MNWEAIIAFDEKFGIGYKGKLPWPKNAEDMEFFREKTEGKTLLMGRNTWESLPKKPLPGRDHIVLTTDLNFKPPRGVKFFHKMTEVFNYTSTFLTEDDVVIVCGGASMYYQFLPVIEKFYTTLIKGIYESDTRLPAEVIVEIYNRVIFEVSETESRDSVQFKTLQRIGPSEVILRY